MKSGKKKNKHKDYADADDTHLPPGLSDEIKRLNRITGQVEGIRKMLEAGRELGDVLIQFKAVHSALRSIEQRIFTHYVEDCVEDILTADRRKEREAKIEELLELFKQA